MGNKKLRIELVVDLNNDGHPEVDVMPVDSAIPDNVAQPIGDAIALADLTDANPGDGKLEYRTVVKYPIRLFGRTFNLSLPFKVFVYTE